MSHITDCKLPLLLNQVIFVLAILFFTCKNAENFNKHGKDLGISTHTRVNWVKHDGLHTLLLLTSSTSH